MTEHWQGLQVSNDFESFTELSIGHLIKRRDEVVLLLNNPALTPMELIPFVQEFEQLNQEITGFYIKHIKIDL